MSSRVINPPLLLQKFRVGLPPAIPDRAGGTIDPTLDAARSLVEGRRAAPFPLLPKERSLRSRPSTTPLRGAVPLPRKTGGGSGRRIPAFFFALALTCPNPSNAQPASCSIRSAPLDFALYSALDPAPRITLGRIELACFPPAATAGARVTLSTGNSGQFLDRNMVRGNFVLHYNLYADTARRRVLGDGSGGSEAPQVRTRSLGRFVFPLFAVIPPGQAVPAGEYSDIIRVDVEF